MFTHKTFSIAAGFLVVVSISAAQAQEKSQYGFGTTVSDAELAKYFSIPADGRGLPAGSGKAADGAKIYADSCAVCHGEKLEGNPAKGIGGDKLIGGRGSLATKTPVKTVESYWPYATTLFDYVKRAMPFNAPGSMSDNDVYAVVAYILSEAKIIKPTDVMDAKTLPKVAMPNKDGFIPDPRPELSLYR
jgi:mono/diheme cytochrome c family protein